MFENNNNSFSLVTITIMTLIISLLILLSFSSLLYHNTTNPLTAVYGQSSNDSGPVIIHGGGTVLIALQNRPLYLLLYRKIVLMEWYQQPIGI
ncbi:MAG: hypothetical protein K0R16_827 [Nitrososphaeraceae archaeon]|nr:hypothetical protein [Nitrososphaeraceae archaeon]